jgi:hypothetical protein
MNDNPFESHPFIFIVDDEPSIATMMSVILQMNLFDAVPFADLVPCSKQQEPHLRITSSPIS